MGIEVWSVRSPSQLGAIGGLVGLPKVLEDEMLNEGLFVVTVKRLLNWFSDACTVG